MIDGYPQEGAPKPNWSALVQVAHELQKWVDALPVWAEQSGEAWAAYKRRHGQGEQDLAKMLLRMPGCTITHSPNGSTTTLTLGGVEAKAQGGLAAACQSWIAKIQRNALGVSRTTT